MVLGNLDERLHQYMHPLLWGDAPNEDDPDLVAGARAGTESNEVDSVRDRCRARGELRVGGHQFVGHELATSDDRVRMPQIGSDKLRWPTHLPMIVNGEHQPGIRVETAGDGQVGVEDVDPDRVAVPAAQVRGDLPCVGGVVVWQRRPDPVVGQKATGQPGGHMWHAGRDVVVDPVSSQ